MVMFDPFFRMSDETLAAAIDDLAAQIATGATQLSSPNEGSIGYVGRAEALRTMKLLQRSWHARKGIPFESGDSVRYREVIVRGTGQ